MTDDPLPAEHLSPLATLVDEALARVGYDVATATEAIDDAVPDYGGLFDPATTPDELRHALEHLLASDLSRPSVPEPTGDSFVLYVDGSSRGNPGPAGAGAVIMDAEETQLARLGRPVGSRTGNNTAEYVALHLGLSELLARYEPASLEVRIDSRTVIRDVWVATIQQSRVLRRIVRPLRRRCRASRNTSTRTWPTATRIPPMRWRRSAPISRRSDPGRRIVTARSIWRSVRCGRHAHCGLVLDDQQPDHGPGWHPFDAATMSLRANQNAQYQL